MTWREIPATKFNSLRNALTIDVRSPCEHEAERIPGSINVPLLSDTERVLVGINYKEKGEMFARRHALTLISPKIPSFVDQLLNLRQHGQTVVIYCWRGGLRSEAVASVLSIAGLECFRLTGGYKAWRAQVLKEFADDTLHFSPVVLHGLTGVGKTELLAHLKAQGVSVLDLEMLAAHRGSVFGALGRGNQPTQKNFDGILWQELQRIDRSKPVVIEAESRRIGKLNLPDFVVNRIQKGVPILVNGSLTRRAQRIAEDYLAPNSTADASPAIAQALELMSQLKSRIGTKTLAYIKELVLNSHVNQAIELLLTDYYDPLYRRQIEASGPFCLEVDSDNPEKASEKIVDWISRNSEMVMGQKSPETPGKSNADPVPPEIRLAID